MVQLTDRPARTSEHQGSSMYQPELDGDFTSKYKQLRNSVVAALEDRCSLLFADQLLGEACRYSLNPPGKFLPVWYRCPDRDEW